MTPEIAAVDNGCKWRALPSDFPPFQTVYGFFARWATMDPQSVKAAETVSRDTRRFDGAKLINGRKGT